MARKGNPISVRLYLNRSSDSSWFSDSYYGKLVYQDINLRSYFGSIRPPTRLTFGFRLGRCIIIHFQKITFINFFLPCRPQPQRRKRRKKSRSMKMKGRWWGFGKVGPIECLYSSEGRKEERNEVRGRRAGKRVESIRGVRAEPIGLSIDDQKKQNEIRVWPKKKQRYGYHDRSPSIKKNLSKSLRVRGGSKHPKYAALNYSVMQYLFHTKNKIHFDPVLVLNHFVAPGVVEPSTMKRANAQGRSLDKRIRSRIAFFVESSTSEKKCLAEAKKRLTHFIHQANDLRPCVSTRLDSKEPAHLLCLRLDRGKPEGRRIRPCASIMLESYRPCVSTRLEARRDKPGRAQEKDPAQVLRYLSLKTLHLTTCLFPSLGAAFYGVSNHIFFDLARRKLLGQLRRKCWNLMGKDKVMKLIDKFIDLGGIRELIKGIEMMIEIILKNRRFPYGYNSYLNEVKKMRSLLSNRTNTNTVIESVKVQSVYQSASPIAQDISFQPKKKRGSFRSIFSQIVKKIPSVMKKGVEGIRICCSGRLGGAEIARTECGKYGKTSCNVLHRKIDYASAEVSTRYGIIGVKVWISYSPK